MPTPGERAPLPGHPLLSLALRPRTPTRCYHGDPLPCYFVASKFISRPCWLVPEPGVWAHPWLHVCVGNACCEGETEGSPLLFFPQPTENKPLIITYRSVLLFLSWAGETWAERAGWDPNLSQACVGAMGWCHPLAVSTLRPKPRRWH